MDCAMGDATCDSPKKCVVPEIVVVGAAGMDLTARTNCFPRPGETVLGTRFTTTFGGKGGNTAVQAALLNEAENRSKVAFVSCIGSDKFGDAYFEYLCKVGINIEGVQRVHEATGVAQIIVNEEGENVIVMTPGANKQLSSESVKAASVERLIKNAKSVCCQHEISTSANVAALQIAKSSSRNIITLFSPSPMLPFEPTMYSLCDYIILNIHEAQQLLAIPFPSSESVEKQQQWYLQIRRTILSKLEEAQEPILGLLCVVVTNGEGDCFYDCVDSVGEQHSYSGMLPVMKIAPENVVNTVGAGDSFMGALSYFLVQGWCIHGAIQNAATVAGYSVMKEGASESYRDRASLPTELFSG